MREDRMSGAPHGLYRRQGQREPPDRLWKRLGSDLRPNYLIALG
jgi:hypothetical protein